jgi:hypothetical protein
MSPRCAKAALRSSRRWARLAFAMLLAAAAANLGIATAETLGAMATLTQLSAARHLVAQGFLLPLIVLMAARILPGYSSYMLHRARMIAALVGSLLVADRRLWPGLEYHGRAGRRTDGHRLRRIRRWPVAATGQAPVVTPRPR